MNMRTRELPASGPEADFDRRAGAAVAGVLAAAVLALAACSDGVPHVVSQAFAAPVESQPAYLPTLFPTPASAPAEPIQGF